MKTGWQNEFYKRRWKAAGLEPGDIKSIDDIVKLPMFDSADIKKDQEENPPFGLINGDVYQENADDADEIADQRRHHRQAAADALCSAGMGVERADPRPRALHLRRAPRRPRADPAHLLARQCRLVLLQGLPRLSRRAADHHRHRRGDQFAAANRDRPGVGQQCLVRAPGIRHPARQGRARRIEFRRARSQDQVPRLRAWARHREHVPQAARKSMGLRRLRHVRHPRDGHGRLRVPAKGRPAFPRGQHFLRSCRRRGQQAGRQTARSAT